MAMFKKLNLQKKIFMKIRHPLYKKRNLKKVDQELIKNFLYRIFKYIYLIIVPFLIISLIVARIFSYKKFTLSLTQLTLTKIALFMMLVAGSSYYLFNIIYYNILKNKKNKNFFSNIVEVHLELYQNSLENFDVFIKKIIEKFVFLRFYIGKLLKYFAKNQYNMAPLFFTFQILPKVFVLTCFLIDVFIYKNFYFFYFSLTCLLLILLSDYIIYSLNKEYEKCCNEIEHNIEISFIQDEINLKINENEKEFFIELPPTITISEYVSLLLQRKKNYNDFDLNLSLYFFENNDFNSMDLAIVKKNYQQILYYIVDLKRFINFYKEYKELYIYFQPVLTICYLMGWLTILVYNL